MRLTSSAISSFATAHFLKAHEHCSCAFLLLLQYEFNEGKHTELNYINLAISLIFTRKPATRFLVFTSSFAGLISRAN